VSSGDRFVWAFQLASPLCWYASILILAYSNNPIRGRHRLYGHGLTLGPPPSDALLSPFSQNLIITGYPQQTLLGIWELGLFGSGSEMRGLHP
jgi:hypothetical protein